MVGQHHHSRVHAVLVVVVFAVISVQSSASAQYTEPHSAVSRALGHSDAPVPWYPPRWKTAPQIFSPRFGHAMACTKNHMAFVAGGRDDTSILSDVWSFMNPSETPWLPLLSIEITPVVDATLTSCGKHLCLFGGYNGTVVSNNLHISGVGEGMVPAPFKEADPPVRPPPRSRHAAVSTDGQDGGWELYVLFGLGVNRTHHNDVWRYANVTNNWTQLITPTDAADAPTGLASPCCDVAGSTIWCFGGASAAGGTNNVWQFNIGTHEWARINVTGTPPSNRTQAGCAVAHNGTVLYVFGGRNTTDNRTADNQLYMLDLRTYQWANDTTDVSPRYGHAMCGLGEGLLVTGGKVDGEMDGEMERWATNDVAAASLDAGGNRPLALVQREAVHSPVHISVAGHTNDALWVYDDTRSQFHVLKKRSTKWRVVPAANPIPVDHVDKFVGPLNGGHLLFYGNGSFVLFNTSDNTFHSYLIPRKELSTTTDNTTVCNTTTPCNTSCTTACRVCYATVVRSNAAFFALCNETTIIAAANMTFDLNNRSTSVKPYSSVEWTLDKPLLVNDDAVLFDNQLFVLGGAVRDDTSKTAQRRLLLSSLSGSVLNMRWEVSEWSSSYSSGDFRRTAAGAAAIGNYIFQCGGVSEGALVQQHRICLRYEPLSRNNALLQQQPLYSSAGLQLFGLGNDMYYVGGYVGTSDGADRHSVRSTAIVQILQDAHFAPVGAKKGDGTGAEMVDWTEDRVKVIAACATSAGVVLLVGIACTFFRVRRQRTDEIYRELLDQPLNP